MTRYTKKPVAVEALQISGNLTEIKEFIGENGEAYIEDTAWKLGKGKPHTIVVIHTLEGDMRATDGDYIIKGVKGEFYPCREDIFNETYQVAGKTCTDAVSREAVHDMIENLPVLPTDKSFNWEQKLCLRLADLPAVVPERPKGEWVKGKDGYTRCTNCGSRGSAVKAHFCSHCGADMRGEIHEQHTNT